MVKQYVPLNRIPANPIVTGGLLNSVGDPIATSFNHHTHDPNDYGYGIPQWAPSHPQYGTYGPGSSYWNNAVLSAAIPADSNRVALAPNQSITAAWGIAAELGEIRGLMNVVLGLPATTNWGSTTLPTSLSLAQLNPTTQQSGTINISGTVTASQIISTAVTGTAPLVVSSTTAVPNLNAGTVSDQNGLGRSVSTVYGSAGASHIPLLDGNGMIPITGVEYDATEAITLDALTSGTSTLQNSLNRMRYFMDGVGKASGTGGFPYPPSTLMAGITTLGGSIISGTATIAGSGGVIAAQSGNTITLSLSGSAPATGSVPTYTDWYRDTVITGLGLSYTPAPSQNLTLTGSASGGSLHAASSTVQATPTPTSTTFAVGTGNGAWFTTNQQVTVGGVSATITGISGDTLTVSGLSVAPAAGATVTQNTYYLTQTWTGPAGESTASSEQTVTIPVSANTQVTTGSIGVTLPTPTTGFGGAITTGSIYLGRKIGAETLQVSALAPGAATTITAVNTSVTTAPTTAFALLALTGTAMIGGTRQVLAANSSQTAGASTTTYYYWNGTAFQSNTTGTTPAGYLPLWSVTTSATAITGASDLRTRGLPMVAGEVLSMGNATTMPSAYGGISAPAILQSRQSVATSIDPAPDVYISRMDASHTTDWKTAGSFSGIVPRQTTVGMIEMSNTATGAIASQVGLYVRGMGYTPNQTITDGLGGNSVVGIASLVADQRVGVGSTNAATMWAGVDHAAINQPDAIVPYTNGGMRLVIGREIDVINNTGQNAGQTTFWSDSTGSELVGLYVTCGSDFNWRPLSTTSNGVTTWSYNWSSTLTYNPGDAVTYSSATWYCLTANTNSAPTTSNPAWKQLATGNVGPHASCGINILSLDNGVQWRQGICVQNALGTAIQIGRSYLATPPYMGLQVAPDGANYGIVVGGRTLIDSTQGNVNLGAPKRGLIIDAIGRGVNGDVKNGQPDTGAANSLDITFRSVDASNNVHEWQMIQTSDQVFRINSPLGEFAHFDAANKNVAFSGGVQPATPAGAQQSGTLWMGKGAPTGGSAGDFYFRTDATTTANQRLYVNQGGVWAGIL